MEEADLVVDNQVEEAVREKRRCFKLWKAGGSRAAYNTAKRTSSRAVHQARSEAEKVALQKIDPRSGDVYRLAKQMRRDSQDVMGEKPVKNDAGQLSLDEEAKKEAWKEHYERLINVEFPWNPEDLSEESPVEGPSEPITLEIITKAISKMASGKAARASGTVTEKPVGKADAVEVHDLIEDIISEGCIPTDWQESFIVNLYKGKGDALNRGNYRGLKLIEQVMKVLERVMEGLYQAKSWDRWDALWLHVWSWHYWCNFYCMSATGEALGCQQAALHGLRRPGESIWSSSMGCHAQTRNWRVAGASGPVHVQGCEKQGKSRWWVQRGVGVGVGVHQGSVLSPLLFIIVLEALSREFRTGCPWELLYADDLMISAESMEELLVKVQTWKRWSKKGLRVNMGKTVRQRLWSLALISTCWRNLESIPVVPVSQELVVLMQSSVVAASTRCIGNAVALRDHCALTLSSGAPDVLGLLRLSMKEVEVGNEKLEVVPEFCYLGDMLSTGGGCELVAITRCKCA